MPICKIILRLDFARPCFPIMDKAGYLFAKLGELSDTKGDSTKKFFDNLKENHKDRLIWGERARGEDSEFASLQVAPTYTVCVLETSQGFELRSFEREELVQKMLRLMHEFLTEFRVTQLARCGIRFIYLGQFQTADTVSSFGQQIAPNFRKAIDSSIGAPSDFGIVVDGKSAANVNYQLKIGPYSAIEAEKYFDQVGKAVGRRSDDNLIVDLDMFEEATTLHVNPSKWAVPLLSNAGKLIDDLKKVIAQEVESDVTA